MIFAIFGTSEYPFERLLSALEDYHLRTNEDIFAQIGNTENKKNIIKCMKFVKQSEMIKFIKKAEIVITQGGAGSIIDCLKLKAKIIAVPRLMRNKECNHDQTELIKKLHEQKKIIYLKNLNDLSNTIKKVKELPNYDNKKEIPNQFCSNINEIIINYFD